MSLDFTMLNFHLIEWIFTVRWRPETWNLNTSSLPHPSFPSTHSAEIHLRSTFSCSWPGKGETDFLTSITSLVAIQSKRSQITFITNYISLFTTCQLDAADYYNRCSTLSCSSAPGLAKVRLTRILDSLQNIFHYLQYYSAWKNLLSTSIIFRWVFWSVLIVSISLNVKAVRPVRCPTSR